jgi:hypothetical protein
MTSSDYGPTYFVLGTMINGVPLKDCLQNHGEGWYRDYAAWAVGYGHEKYTNVSIERDFVTTPMTREIATLQNSAASPQQVTMILECGSMRRVWGYRHATRTYPFWWCHE